jgi:two-component system nitrogen regulation sensor histidine kinase NtrY
MKEFRKYTFYILSGLFFTLAVILENQILNHPEVKIIHDFQETLLKQESILSKYLDQEEKKFTRSLSSENFASTFKDLNHLFEDEGLGFLIFSKQKLVFWSNNQFAFPNLAGRIYDQNRLMILPNGVYVAQKRLFGDYEIIGLVHIKNNYSYENQYLENSFVAPFSLPAEFKITTYRDKKSFEIKDANDQYLFSVLPSGAKTFGESMLYFPAIMYMLGFIFLLLSIYYRIECYRKKNFVVKMFLVLIALFFIYWTHIILGIPGLLKNFEIFSPEFYALSNWLPSLGDFFLIAILFFFWSLVFVREFPSADQIKSRLILPSYLFVFILYLLVELMIGNLIQNSSITYKLNRITDIDQYSISSYLAIAMLLFSVFLIHLKIIQRTEYLNRKPLNFKINLGGAIVSIALCFLIPSGWVYIMILFFMVNVLHCKIKKMQISIYSLSYTLLFISLFSIISLLIVYNTIKKRDLEVQKLLAINVSSEQDPVAEVFLTRMQNQLVTDSIIPTLLKPPYNELENHLTRNYFSGYFRKYDVQYTFCAGNDSVLIQPENISEPCFPFFEKMIERSGIKIPGSSFYFMNNMNGRVSYFGKLHYMHADVLNGISIFIEINSKVISEGIGFPELLLDRSLIKPYRYKYLSYAKYFDDELVNRSGEYTYNYYLQSYNLKKNAPEFQIIYWEGYDHLIYTFDERNHIIVSNRSLTFIDYLISFPYIFVFYLMFVMTVAMIGNSNFRKLIIPRDLRFRIQAAIISVVLVSLLLVAAGTIYYNIRQYRERHQVDLQEKIKSISEEIKNQLIYVNSINPELQQWLYQELYKLSNIFRTDINIYNVNGELVATSRPEIFAKGVTTKWMNSKAFYELSERYQLNYFQPEKIGKLSYLSAYEPIINTKGDYLGYLNLPYFTREDELKQGISTFIVAFINLYLILFLASVIVAVLLSNRITQPLSLIREKLKGIQLGKKNEQINYQAEDEIGALVKEYNHKVDELAESAELLARSERESAWREMAKQIAHEIKNPLTPMKLNIQYLQRVKSEDSEHYSDFFDRVTKNLIEQIDTLSGIATEFSNFAQIPKAKNEVFNLIEVLQNVCLLFEPNQNLHFSFETNGMKVLSIFADKEQLSRAFLNLVKNAIQSISPDQKGEIQIQIQKVEQVALISINDNGSGISEEAQAHLFEPNFTTKTSGMGLGLSIVRNIINNFKGRIWYETSETTGTSFYVEIPIHEKTPTA